MNITTSAGNIESQASYRVELNNLQAILAVRGLQARGPVQQFLASEIARRSDPRVPFRAGPLKNTVQILKGGEEIKYTVPYARRQFYNPQVGRATGTLRGGYWFQRTINAEGAQIFMAAAKMAGGRFEK